MLALALGTLIALLAGTGPGCSGDHGPPESGAARGGAARAAGFIDSRTCAECHPHEAAGWAGSHHDDAMQPATPATVLGDFDDAYFEQQGQRARFSREGDRHRVRTEGPDGVEADFDVAYTFGVDPLQQYLIELPGGRLQCLTIAWDVHAKRWFSLYPDERFAADDPLHWTGRYQRWNAMCAECHSTAIDKGYDPVSDTYRTSWHEPDVGCQACHGPGGEHVERERARAAGRPAAPGSGLSVRLARGDSAAQLDACARCHSRREALTESYVHGEPFVEHFAPARLTEGLYTADGQIEGEVFDWGSFVQSKMHARGVTCSDCHDPHSLELWLPGDAVCTQCHTTQAPHERFPTLTAKRYDSPEHHHHPVESEGARCVSCHMPARTYMICDARRDHSLRIPRPDVSARIGTPNACNGCHTDRSADWAAEQVAQWRGPDAAPLEEPFALAFFAARRGERSAAPALAALVGDAEEPALVRATALELLGALKSGESALVAALEDKDPLVRASAVRGLDGFSAERVLRPWVAALGDPSRAVQVDLGRVLAGLDPSSLPIADAERWRAARGAFRAAQDAALDLPAAHLNLGLDAQRRGAPAEAIEAFERALELDPWFLPARFDLANLLDALDRPAAAERVLAAGRERAPEDGELAYSHGLVLATLGRLEESAAALASASRALPGRARVRFNHGAVLMRLERSADAEAVLLEAAGLDPDDLDAVAALASLYAKRGELERARPWAERLEAAGVPGVRGWWEGLKPQPNEARARED